MKKRINLIKGEGGRKALIYTLVLSVIAVAATISVARWKSFIGPVIIFLGFLPLVVLKLAGRKVRTTGADIIYGMLDTGIMGIFALTGASLAGIIGGIIGAGVGDSITDAFAGIFEGKTSELLRKRGIVEDRTPLSISMGKMSGCLLGFGTLITIVWTIIKI